VPETEDQQFQRVMTIAIMVAAALLGTLLVAWGPADQATPTVEVAAAADLPTTTTTAPATVASTVAGTTATTAATTTTTPAATTTTAAGTDPGSLPQTDDRPSASGATFTAGVDALWEAIRQDEPELGYPFFFPKNAYLQVKAISDPAGDYQNRLIANFDQDVHTLHAQLGADAANAKFVGISVPDDQAVFVQPGEESNKGTYWRVYGTTMQYEVDGQTGSFPVTSLISWRGEWYVVHLGAIR
jgi:hypothetical protein